MEVNIDGYLSAVILARHKGGISETASHSHIEAVVGPPHPSGSEKMLMLTRQHQITACKHYSLAYLLQTCAVDKCT